MEIHPYRFRPIYVEKIWGGRSLERLFGRPLPPGRKIGESWELADLPGGVSVVAEGPSAGATLTQLTRTLGPDLLGQAPPTADGRFPLLLKLLDAQETLSLQVHPDEEAAGRIGRPAICKTECWYVVESRGGFIYKGLLPGVGVEDFRRAVEGDALVEVVRRMEVVAGEFHYLPAGTVHALGAGVVVAEVQTPSDTTFRLTDWGRGRQVHPAQSMQCVRFRGGGPPEDPARGRVVTDSFTVELRRGGGGPVPLPSGRCAALMVVSAGGGVEVRHAGGALPAMRLRPGDTVLLPAALRGPVLAAEGECSWLEVTLPQPP